MTLFSLRVLLRSESLSVKLDMDKSSKISSGKVLFKKMVVLVVEFASGPFLVDGSCTFSGTFFGAVLVEFLSLFAFFGSNVKLVGFVAVWKDYLKSLLVGFVAIFDF